MLTVSTDTREYLLNLAVVVDITFCRYHISFAEDPVAVIEAICGEGFPQLMEEDVLASKLYPTLTRFDVLTLLSVASVQLSVCRTTCGSFYRAASEELVKSLKADGASKKTAPIKVSDTDICIFTVLVSACLPVCLSVCLSSVCHEHLGTFIIRL